MPTTVNLPGYNPISFGDDWSADEINKWVAENKNSLPSIFGQDVVAQAAAPKPSPGILSSFGTGFKEGFSEGGIPFYSAGQNLYDATKLLAASRRAQQGVASDEDIAAINDFNQQQQLKEQQSAARDTGDSIAYGIGRVLGNFPGFAGELATTGGVATAGEKAAITGIQKTLQATARLGAEEAAEKAAEFAAKNAAGRIIRGTTGALAQTIPASGLRAAAGTAERMTPDLEVTPVVGGNFVETTKEGDPFLPAAYKAFGDQFVEVLSERSGGFLEDMLGGAAKRIGLNRLPGVDAVSGLKQAIATRLVEKYPALGNANNVVRDIADRAGWNGVIGEILEERAGEAGKFALGVEDYKPPTLEQLATEALAFGVLGTGMKGLEIANAMRPSEKAKSQQFLDALESARDSIKKNLREADRSRQQESDRQQEAQRQKLLDDILAGKMAQGREQASFYRQRQNAIDAQNARENAAVAESNAFNERLRQQSANTDKPIDQITPEQLQSGLSQFGPGARPAPAAATPQFTPGQSVIDMLRAARANDERLAAEAKAAAARPVTLPPTESSLPADAGAAPVGGVPVAAPALQSEIDKLSSFMDRVETESINLPSPAKMRSLAQQAQKLGYITKADFDSILSTHKSMGSRDDTSDAMSELTSTLSYRMDDLVKKQSTEAQKTINVSQAQAPAPAPAATVQSTKAKAPRRAKNATAVQAEGVANANQVEGRVEVPRGDQPQGAAQDAAGQPGPVQVAPGEAVKAVEQAPAAKAQPLSPADVLRNAAIDKAQTIWENMNGAPITKKDIGSFISYLQANAKLISPAEAKTAGAAAKKMGVEDALQFVGNLIPKRAVAKAAAPAAKPAPAAAAKATVQAPAPAPIVEPAAAKKESAKPAKKSGPPPKIKAVAKAEVAAKPEKAAAKPAKIKPVAKAIAKAAAPSPVVAAVRKSEVAKVKQAAAPTKAAAAPTVIAETAPAPSTETPTDGSVESRYGTPAARAVLQAQAEPGVLQTVFHGDKVTYAFTNARGMTFVVHDQQAPEPPKKGRKSKNDVAPNGIDTNWVRRRADAIGFRVGQGEQVAAPEKPSAPIPGTGIIPVNPSLATQPRLEPLTELPPPETPAGPLRYAKSEVDKKGNRPFVKVGDWVRVNAPAFGKKLSGLGKVGGIYGRVKSVVDGVAKIYIERIGVRGKGDAKVIAAGVKPGQDHLVNNGKYLTRIEPELDNFYPRTIGKERGDELTSLLIKAENSKKYDDYIETFGYAQGQDAQAITDRKNKEKKIGRPMALAMEAVHFIENYYEEKRNRSAKWYVSPGEDVVEDRKYIGQVYQWLDTNLKAKSGRIEFSSQRAERNIASDLIKAKRLPSTSLDALNEQGREAEAATDEAGNPREIKSLSELTVDTGSKMLSDYLSESVRQKIADVIFNSTRNISDPNPVTQKELARAIELAIGTVIRTNVKAPSRIATFKKYGNTFVDSKIRGTAENIARQTYDAYRKGGLAAVTEIIANGNIPMTGQDATMFAAAAIDTGNQSLSAGDISLADAINTVLEQTPADSPMHGIARRLLQAGVNPQVKVLSDEEFDALGDRFVGENAFYNSDPNVNTIYVRQSATAHDYLVMHEAVHAGTVWALRNNPQFLADITALRAAAIEKLGAEYYGLEDRGDAFTNAAEFVAESLTNDEFKDAMREIKVTPQESLWDRFKNLVKRLFGVGSLQERTLLDMVMEVSTRNFGPNTAEAGVGGDEILNAARRFENNKQVNEALDTPGLSSGAKAAIQAFAAAQAGLVPASTVNALKSAPSDVQSTLGVIARQATARAVPAQLSSLSMDTEEEISRAEEAANGVIRLHREFEDLTANISNKLEKISADIAESRAEDLNNLAKAKNTIAATQAITNTMLADYQSYLRARKDAGVGTGSALDNEIRYVSDVLDKNYSRSKEIQKAVSLIADFIPASVVSSATSNADVRTYKDASGVDLEQHLRGNVSDSTINFLLAPASGGTYRMDGMKRLIPALQLIQKLKADATAGEQYISHFESAWSKLRGTKDRPVSAAMMARSYAKLSVQEKEAIKAARLLSSKIDSEDDRLNRYTKALDILTDMQADPAYLKQVSDAADLANILDPGTLGVDIPGTLKTRFVINGKTFDFESRFDPKSDEENKAKRSAAIVEIANELATTNDPIRKRSLLKMRNHLALYGGQLGDAALNIGDFDVINRIRSGNALTRPLVDRMFLFRQIAGELGVKLRNSAKVVMVFKKEIEKVRENPVYGDYAMNRALKEAIDSHPGMDGQKWDKEVLNEILGSNQERTAAGLNVGDIIPVFGHKVTKEDMAVAKMQAKYADGLYRAAKGAERGGILMHHPTLVRETYTVGGQTRVQYRNAFASGGLMTPRSFDRSMDEGGSIKMAQQWAATKVDGDPAATLANRLKLLDDPTFLNRFAVAHVTESNPEYKNGSKLEPIYESIADGYRKAGAPTTFDGLVKDIAARVVSTSSDVYADVRDKLLSEISERTDAYLSALNAEDHAAKDVLNGSNLSADSIVSAVSSSNNFTKPRGKMLMPSNFYTHTMSSEQARGAVVQGAVLPAQMHQLELMDKLEKALKEKSNELNKDLDAAESKSYREYITLKYFGGRKSMMKGTAYANRMVLNDLMEQLNSAIQGYRAMLSKPAPSGVEESVGKKALRVGRTMMVSVPVAAGTNNLSATAAGDFFQHTFLNGFTFKKSGLGAAAAPFIGGPKAIWKNAAYIASGNKQMLEWASRNKASILPIINNFAKAIDEMARQREAGSWMGSMPEQMSLRDRAEVVRAIGHYGSPVEAANGGGSKLSSMIEKAFSKWWLPNIWLAVQGVSPAVDRAANAATLMNIDSALNDAFRAGYKIIDNRAASKSAGWDDWTNAANGITVDEAAAGAGWSQETLTRLKQVFSTMGGLEYALHDYWKRIQEAKANGTPLNEVPPIADKGFYSDVALELAGLTNLPVDSMRPDITHTKTIAGDIYNFVFTFSGWFNSWFSALGSLVAKDSRRGLLTGAGVSFLSLCLLMALLGANGAWLNEMRGMIYELTKGRPYPVVRMSDVLRDGSWQSIGKLFGASVALMVPYAGESVADLFGAQNYRASITDIAALSQPLQLINNLASAIKTGAQTGDWTGQMVRMARSTIPGSDMVLNRIPSVRGMDAVADAARVARVNSGELELNPRAGGGAGGTQTHASNLVRRAIAASAEGNMDEARSLLQQAAEEKDWKYVASALRGQNIDVKTFGRQLTPDEKTALLGRMSDSQREVYQRGENAINQLVASVPAMSGGGGGGVGSGMPRAPRVGTGAGGSSRGPQPFKAFNDRVRQLKRMATPQALRLVKRKISALKPKKLRLSGGSSASVPGSRLLRPVSRAMAGAGRLPGALRMPRVPSFA